MTPSGGGNGGNAGITQQVPPPPPPLTPSGGGNGGNVGQQLPPPPPPPPPTPTLNNALGGGRQNNVGAQVVNATLPRPVHGAYVQSHSTGRHINNYKRNKGKKEKDGTTTDPTSNYASGITFDPSVWFCEISEPHRHQEELRAPITITDL